MRVFVAVQEASLPQRHMQDALPRLVERGHDVRLSVLGRPGPLLEVARDLDVEADALSSASPALVLHAAARMRRIIRAWQPDVVHAHEPLPAIAAGAARAGAPVLYQRHHLTGSRRLRFASRTATRLTRGTLAVSDAVAARARDEDRRPAERVVVAHNGVAPLRAVGDDEVAALRAELELTPDLVLVAVSRLRREKGLHHLLSALALIAEAVQLVIVGSGPEEAALCAASGPGVHLVGHREDVACWYALGDIVVLPSLQEALPLAAIEAMAMGRPIIASAVGGLPELVVDGVTGALVPAADPAALARAIDDLAAAPKRREAMGAAARERYAAGFSADAMVSGWERGYETL